MYFFTSMNGRVWDQGKTDQALARTAQNASLNDRVEENDNEDNDNGDNEKGSSTPHTLAEDSHQFCLGSDLEPSPSDADTKLNASATLGDNATENPNRLRIVCAHCKSPTHRSTCCPHLPCRHCKNMGHVGTHCPRRVEQLIQKRKDSKRRYNAKKAAARSKVSAGRLGAVCTQCKKPYHQRTTCPDLPCKHCNTIGHVGTDCPDRKEELADATRKAKRRYNERIAAAGRGAPSAGNQNSSCSQCRQPGHRRPACPQLPCGRCSTVGHVVTDCPLKAKEVKQWMRDAQTRHKKRRDTVAGVHPSTALCTHCNQPGHRRPACPSLPCRYCDKMGHVGIGTNCPMKAAAMKQRHEDCKERLKRKSKESAQHRVETCSGVGPTFVIKEEELESN